MRIVLTAIGCALACLVVSRPAANAQVGQPSWLQWGGPERSFQLPGRGLHWTGPAPKKAWQRDLGDGYAAIVGDASTLYAASRQGEAMQVAALDAETGRTLWTRELWADLKGTFRDVGYSNSPIAFGDPLILPVGGKGKGLVAFRQRDGSTAWTSGDLENAMSSPILVDVGGEVQPVSLMVGRGSPGIPTVPRP
jgi:hypothetical protein